MLHMEVHTIIVTDYNVITYSYMVHTLFFTMDSCHMLYRRSPTISYVTVGYDLRYRRHDIRHRISYRTNDIVCVMLTAILYASVRYCTFYDIVCLTYDIVSHTYNILGHGQLDIHRTRQ